MNTAWLVFLSFLYIWAKDWSSSCIEPRPIQRSLRFRWWKVCQRCSRSNSVWDIGQYCWFYLWSDTGKRIYLLCPLNSFNNDNRFILSKLNRLFWWQGVGGIIELAPGYLPAVYSSIKKAGGLFIADEVQSGFARTGSNFWGFESHGVVPDIVTMAKVNLLFWFQIYLENV